MNPYSGTSTLARVLRVSAAGIGLVYGATKLSYLKATRKYSLGSTQTASMTKQTAVLVGESSKDQSKPGLTVGEIDIPTPGDGAVLVKMLLRPVNPSDVASTSSSYPGFNRAKVYPAVPGLEGVGVVKESSPGANFKPGTRVVSFDWGGIRGRGTWQQYLAVEESKLIAVPDSVSNEAAAQFIINPITCYGFLDVLQIPEGKWLIQGAANSELGLQMISLCKHRGLKTVNLVRRKEAEQQILDAGGDAVICTSELQDFAAKVKEVTNGEMAFGAIDPVAGTMTGKMAAAVRPGGSVLVFGAMGGITVDGIGLRDLLFRGVHVAGFWLSRYLDPLSSERRKQVLEDVMQLLADGVIKPRAGRKFPLEQVHDAIAASQQSGRDGKVLLEG